MRPKVNEELRDTQQGVETNETMGNNFPERRNMQIENVHQVLSTLNNNTLKNQILWKPVWQVLKRLQIKTSCNMAFLFLGMCAKDLIVIDLLVHPCSLVLYS